MIWGAKWDKQYNEKTELLAEQWAEALADLNMPTMKEGLSKARLSLQWPPSIAEFIQLCRGNEIVIEGFTPAKAAELADKKVKRLVPKNYDEVTKVREIFKDLECKIYTTKSELCDFVICATDKCYHYTILDSARLAPWLCVKHEEN